MALMLAAMCSDTMILELALNRSYEELYLSCRVMFRNGFDSVLGGMRPGLRGR